VYLQPGEEKTVQLHLPIEAFALFDDNGKQKVSYGDYTVYVGGSQPDTRSIKLTGQKPLQMVLKTMNSTEIE
jgi:beta-glucosidase